MSIRLMTRIWDSGAYSGGTLLVLLALADWANDQGERIFPHLDTLAAKARLSIKQCRRVLEALLVDQVIEDLTGNGVKAGEMLSLRLNLDRLSTEGQNVPEGHYVQDEGHLGKNGGTPCPDSGTKCPPYIEEPSSYPSKEPSREPPAASPPPDASLFPDLPSQPVSKAKAESTSQEINSAFDAYNTAAARLEWGECQSRNEDRRRKLKQRLRDSGGLAGWDAAIEKAEASDFCMGRAPPRPGHPPFKMDFDTLVQQSFFVKLMEGKYDNRQSSKPPDSGGSIGIAARVAARRAAARAHGDQVS